MGAICQFWMSGAWLGLISQPEVRDINGNILSINDTVLIKARVVGLMPARIVTVQPIYPGQPLIGLDSLAVFKEI